MTQRFQLFAAATKDKGIAAFQAYHAFTFLRFTQQDLVDFLLWDAVVTRAFPHKDPIGIAAYQVHNVVGDEAIVNHDIRLLDLL